RGVGLLGAAQHVDGAEPLPVQAAQGTPQVAQLAGGDVVVEDAVGPVAGAFPDQVGRGVQDDRDARQVVVPGDAPQLLAGVRVQVGGVDHGEQAAPQPPVDDGVEQVEGVVGGGLVV